jgi:hypothetical protein
MWCQQIVQKRPFQPGDRAATSSYMKPFLRDHQPSLASERTVIDSNASNSENSRDVLIEQL